jgi:hypothetical protein
MSKKAVLSAELHIPLPVIVENGQRFNEGNFVILDCEVAVSYVPTERGMNVTDANITGFTQESMRRLIESLPELLNVKG